MSEQWRAIAGFEGNYKISSLGRVWSRPRNYSRGGIMKLQSDRRGYPVVYLCLGSQRKPRKVHRLIMEAFVGPCPDGMEVRHLDGDPTNSTLGNLAYGTPTENAADRKLHGTEYNTNLTHCRHGHEFTAENTYWRRDRVARACRACNKERSQKYLRSRRAKTMSDSQ